MTRTPADLPADWILGVSSFTFTPEIIDARRDAIDIVAGIVAGDTDGGVCPTIELEPGSVWRSFPTPSDSEVDALRTALERAGGSVSIVGLSLDDFVPQRGRRTPAERLDFLLPQLRAAHRVGATGVRLPIGQAGRDLLVTLQPVLDELGLTLFEEVQGQQAPTTPQVAAALDTIADLDDPRIRVLVDISLLMPALPTSYLQLLATSDLPPDLVRRVSDEWREPRTADAVTALLRSGGVPGPVHTAYMNMLVRFGRSSAADLADILPLTGAFHLKFWDLDDTDGRVSAPLADLGELLAGAGAAGAGSPRSGFAGTLTSEWGGHEWLDAADPTDMTRRHLAHAREALGVGVARAEAQA